MPRKPRNNDWDDGSTVAPMDLDGMQSDPSSLPGQSARVPWYSLRKRNQPRPVPDPTLTRRETWKLIANAVGAALLLAAVFGVLGWLFIEFCLNVWFKS